MVRHLITCYSGVIISKTEKECSFIVEVEDERQADFIRYSVCKTNKWFGLIERV